MEDKLRIIRQFILFLESSFRYSIMKISFTKKTSILINNSEIFWIISRITANFFNTDRLGMLSQEKSSCIFGVAKNYLIRSQTRSLSSDLQ
jgi:hypothetical protein